MTLGTEHLESYIADILAYDQLGPLTRKAMREICCPVVARQTLSWVLSSGVPDDRAAAFIRSLDAQGRAKHWAIMERDSDALIKNRSGRFRPK